MPRTKNSVSSKKRRKKILKRAKGFRQGRSKLFKRAKEFSEKGLTYAFMHRRKKKRDFRRLWISRISAACKLNGISYNEFIYGIKKLGINLNRKMLADIAFNHPENFTLLVNQIKGKTG
ncbi:MAG: 50S ribosomal protein L20 [Candidatus Omnitrophica bacterium]|nr:50S ribosomal protein L20 [Candidatus Omnitrophota bacterium]MCM8809226.1 50S ribosomal protein L20 [Candidatus Omnitrophota bacterium]MCM8811086.1 50S ribosomal protein L20 [Candidatus Omnitrophota bacterium]